MATKKQMNDLTFGIELETYGLGRDGAVNALALQDGWRRGYGNAAIDPKGRTWKAVGDSSIDGYQPAEVVSPVLRYEDMELLQGAVRKLRAAGAKVNDSCGIHIHVGVEGAFDVPAIVRLAKYWNRKEKLIKHALGTLIRRSNSYCRDINHNGFIDRLDALRRAPRTMDELNAAWYGRNGGGSFHYDGTRYHALNLHNVWFRGTIEWRLFNATMHAGKIKAYVQFVLAVALHAVNTRAAARPDRAPFNAQTAKYDFRVCLLRLGLIGDEFKTARKHLTKHLQGNAARKNGQPAPVATQQAATPAGAGAETTEERLARETRELNAAGWVFDAAAGWVHPARVGAYTRQGALHILQRARRAA